MNGASNGLSRIDAAEAFYNDLSVGEQAKILTIFKYLGTQGKCHNRQKFKKIEGTDFFEVKSHQIRMPCYFTPDSKIVITHGFRKKGDAIPREEINRAERIKQEDASHHGPTPLRRAK